MKNVGVGSHIQTIKLHGLSNDENAYLTWSTASLSGYQETNVEVFHIRENTGITQYHQVNNLRVNNEYVLTYNVSTGLYSFKNTDVLDVSSDQLVRYVNDVLINEPITVYSASTNGDNLYYLNVEEEDYFLLNGYIVHNIDECATFRCCSDPSIIAYWDITYTNFQPTIVGRAYSFILGPDITCWECISYNVPCIPPPSYNATFDVNVALITEYDACEVCLGEKPSS